MKKISKKKLFTQKRNYPSLIQSKNIGKITSKLNFDWSEHKSVLIKIKEELNELEKEITKKNKNKKRVDEEYGDLLFTIAQLSRHLDVNPEASLIKANNKFKRRFYLLLKEFKNKEIFKESSSDEKEKMWKKIKKL